ncbi:MAG: hypothetical protein GY719_30920 [bacterium]|nr:hypothetical protein [bacterium]
MDIQKYRRSTFFLTALLLLTIAAAPALAAEVETLILFDPMAGETPESIVFDRADNAYITLAFTGEIRKIAPDLTQTSLAFLPIGTPCGPLAVVALGLAIDRHDQLYVAVTACDPANSGIWQVDTDDGSIQLLANAPSFVVWNGIDVHKGFIYAADTFGGLVWRIPAAGGSPEIWADDPLLQIAPGSPFPGPNGVQFFRGSVYVVNSSTGGIVEIPIENDGTAGQASLFGSVFPLGCDEITFDVLGRLYCTTDPFNTLARVSPDGTVEILLTAADLLDGPTSAAFGRKGTNKKNLYITNAAFPIFTTTFRPSLMRLRIEVPGAPDEY